MYIKGFRVKFASYRKFGSKWIRGSVNTFTGPNTRPHSHVSPKVTQIIPTEHLPMHWYILYQM